MGFFGNKSEPEMQPWATPALTTPPAPAPLRYGISDTIALFRTLPQGQDPDLVIQVVRTTLGSLKVQLPDIIADATKRMKLIQERMDQGHAQIAKLEQKLQEHRQEIAAQMADLRETEEVKSRLERAEQIAEDKPAEPPQAESDNKPPDTQQDEAARA
jgi:DNA-binding transcriptional MerR regulator